MNVISFSLFGPASVYTYGAVRNACLVNDYYPGWKTRFYFTNTVPVDVRALLRHHGAQLRYIEPGMVPSPIFGRLLVMADPGVDVWICREAEARFSGRETALVEEWLDSGLPWHVIKDHSGCAMHPVYTGCFGGRGPAAKVPDLSARAFDWVMRQEKKVDWTENKAGWFFRNQEFVRDCLWPKMLADGVFIHWSEAARRANMPYPHYNNSLWRARPVPPDDNTGYVGESYGMDDKPLVPALRDFQ